MLHKHISGILGAAILIASAALTAWGQTGELRGHVIIRQADGQSVPASDAVIDVYRTDVSGKYNTKTNKKGEFVFAGLPYVGTYVIAGSHPSARPSFVPNVKVGRDVDYEVELSPGDGKRLTYDEIKNANAGAGGAAGNKPPSSGGGGDSASDKAKREELLKKNAEIEATNKKITESNETIGRTFKSGNEALTAASAAAKAGNRDEAVTKYSEAVTQYDQGLAADPEQPALLTNKAMALKGRGVERFNASIKTTDEAAKTAGLEQARADFKASAEAANKAVALLKAQTAPADPTELTRFNLNKLAAMSVNSEAMRLFVTKADATQADAGLVAFKEYIAVETDPAKKAKAQLDAAQMLLDAGVADKAFAEFQAIVTAQPESPEANLGAGLSLFATGDKAKFQEAANYLQHFVDVAPDTNNFKADAKAILNELKNTEKVVPEKTTTPRRRRP
jgi:tetratricopeptide (TPR) repeat protein